MSFYNKTLFYFAIREGCVIIKSNWADLESISHTFLDQLRNHNRDLNQLKVMVYGCQLSDLFRLPKQKTRLTM